jgi:hypothetical protein
MDNSKWVVYANNEFKTKNIINLGDRAEFDKYQSIRDRTGVYVVDYGNQSCLFYKSDGMLHSEDGPAIINFKVNEYGIVQSIISAYFYLNGKQLDSEHDFWAETTKLGKALYG